MPHILPVLALPFFSILCGWVGYISFRNSYDKKYTKEARANEASLGYLYGGIALVLMIAWIVNLASGMY